MLEKFGNIFEQEDADAICFTSNAAIKYNGELVMGAGIAKAFRDYFPGLSKEMGDLVKRYGHNVYAVQRVRGQKPYWVMNYPTKVHWRLDADLHLIEKSAFQLVEKTTQLNFRKVYLPRPGCGLGSMSWHKIKPLIENVLDDRFIIIDYR